MNLRGMGWVRDLPDRRDFHYAAPPRQLATLPARVDLRPAFPAVPYDQGMVGSCTANAIAGAMEFERAKEGRTPDWIPSRLFVYYNERLLEGSVNADAGASLRDGAKTVNVQGACPEICWPYDGRLPTDQGGPNRLVFTKPNLRAYEVAARCRMYTYLRVAQDLAQLKGCLASGYPFVLGFTCYQSLMTREVDRTGDIPMPGNWEGVIGGHAVVAVGYDDTRQRFFVRNSWGTSWGAGGYGTLPYAYAIDDRLSGDFWTFRK